MEAQEQVLFTKQLLDQKALDLAYQDFLEEREFPTRALQEYQASIRGFPYTPAAYQYTTQTAPTPSLGQTLLTAAAQGAGLYGTLGGFGFGSPTQKAASGGQIRGGLSGMVESHQNNQSRVWGRIPKVMLSDPDFMKKWGKLKDYERFKEVADFTSRDLLPWQQSARLSKLAKQQNLPPDMMTKLNVADTSFIEESDIGPGRGGISAVAQVSETDETSPASAVGKKQSPISPIRKMIQNAQSPQEAFEAYRESFQPYIKSVKEAQVSEAAADSLEGEAAAALKEEALAGITARKKLTDADLLRLQNRMKARTARYGTEKEELEGFRRDIRRQGEEALEAEKEAGERIQQMHRDERQSLKEQERFEIFAGFGSVGGITEEEAALGLSLIHI